MEKSWRFTMWENRWCKALLALYFVTFVFEREIQSSMPAAWPQDSPYFLLPSFSTHQCALNRVCLSASEQNEGRLNVIFLLICSKDALRWVSKAIGLQCSPSLTVCNASQWFFLLIKHSGKQTYKMTIRRFQESICWLFRVNLSCYKNLDLICSLLSSHAQ